MASVRRANGSSVRRTSTRFKTSTRTSPNVSTTTSCNSKSELTVAGDRASASVATVSSTALMMKIRQYKDTPHP